MQADSASISTKGTRLHAAPPRLRTKPTNPASEATSTTRPDEVTPKSQSKVLLGLDLGQTLVGLGLDRGLFFSHRGGL